MPQRSELELNSTSHRTYSEASLECGDAPSDSIESHPDASELKFSWIGQVLEIRGPYAYLQLKNPIDRGQNVEVLRPRGENLLLDTQNLEAFDGKALERAAQETVIRTDAGDLQPGWILRRSSN